MSGGRYVHVIMPVGSDPFAAAKKATIAKIVRDAGLEARFPDYLPHRPTFALSEMIDEIRGADCIIADLSRERPSCYYELGIAEAVGKSVHLVAEAGTPIHQSATRSLIRYYADLDELARAIEGALREPNSSDGRALATRFANSA
jgi:hypothetical protein